MKPGILSKLKKYFHDTLIGPQLFAFVPALTLGGYWFGGEGVLLFLALVFPAMFAIAGLFSGTGPAWSEARDRDTELRLRTVAEKSISEVLASERSTGKSTAAIVIALDEFDAIERQYGTKATATILKQTALRLVNTLREVDKVVRLDGSRFGIAIGPIRRVDLETLIQMSARLQSAISEPLSVNATRIYVTASVGFCLPNRAPMRSGVSLLDSAERALETAMINGNGSIRAFSLDIKQRATTKSELQSEVASALETGDIVPWFQPQVSIGTGKVTGFEALARWIHPERGIILPRDFLPILEELCLRERLCEVVLSKSLAALRKWEKSGYVIPSVAVNFSSEELSNPKICEKIEWELDRNELSPERLCVEILEDVISVSANDVIVRNIHAISELGCKIDLDDFGAGHASIANIRRFSVDRIKIDRSFITHVDRDLEQQNMVAAILTMAERLNIDTLAEGVETIGEHAQLAQMGCGHAQGFNVAKPMPFEKTVKWMAQYNGKHSTSFNVDQKAV